MNEEFLRKYALYQLSDINEYSEEALEKFISECSNFLETVKSADHVVWEEVMTMSTSKRTDLMQEILSENSESIIPRTYEQQVADFESKFGIDMTSPLTEEEIEEACIDFGVTRAEFDMLLDDESNIEEGLVTNTAKKIKLVFGQGISAAPRIFKYLQTNLKKANWVSDRKTTKLSNVLKFITAGLSIVMLVTAVGWAATLAWVVALIVVILYIISGDNWVMSVIDIARTITFSIYSMIKQRSGNTEFSSVYSAMYSLEKTQLRGCLKSCSLEGNDIPRREQLHIINLAINDRELRDKTPSAIDSQRFIKADCLFDCSMRFMISMVAELFGALKSCIKNTMGVNFKVQGDALHEIRTVQLDTACEPIRAELEQITEQFNHFIKLAFKQDTQSANQWRQALNTQIQQVMNGQHSRPVSVKYGSKTTITPIVFEF